MVTLVVEPSPNIIDNSVEQVTSALVLDASVRDAKNTGATTSFVVEVTPTKKTLDKLGISGSFLSCQTQRWSQQTGSQKDIH